MKSLTFFSPWAHLKMSQKVFFKGEKLSARGILRVRSVKTLTLLALKKPLEHPKILLCRFSDATAWNANENSPFNQQSDILRCT
ncbi:MAG: hypothetical protein AAGI49_13315, partial [Bacteroidota bacterium]